MLSATVYTERSIFHRLLIIVGLIMAIPVLTDMKLLNVQGSCNLDLIFLVDSSGSIGQDGFDNIIQSLNATFPIFQSTIGKELQVGIVQYSSENVFNIATRLGECTTVKCLQDVVSKKMIFTDGMTYTAAAIQKLATMEFYGEFLSKAIVLLTDGTASDEYNLQKMFNLTQEKQIDVYAIGVGSGIQKSELKISANGGTSDERVYQASDFSMLASVLLKVTEDVLENCVTGPYCDVANSKCIRASSIQTYTGGSFSQLMPPGKQIVANLAACPSVTSIGYVGEQEVVISYHNPNLQVMQGYLTGPMWPSEISELSEMQIPVLYLIAVVTPFSVSVAYKIPFDCSLPGIFDLSETTSSAASMHRVKLRTAEMQCTFLDENGKFSSVGIETIKPMSSGYSCQSNHSTIFASIMSLNTFTEPFPVTILSYVTGGISVVSLLLTLVVLLFVRNKLRSDRTVVQINLVTSLLIFHVVTLFSEVALDNNLACLVVAVLAHYFLLCSVAWMLVEGITLTQKTLVSALSGRRSRKEKILTTALAWGIPALIVAAAVGWGFPTNTYMDSTPPLFQAAYPAAKKFNRCFLRPGSVAMIVGVLAPICLAVLLNAVILVRVGHFVFRMSKESENFRPYAERNNSTSNLVEANYKHAKAGLRAMLLLVPAFGVPWCIGTIQIDSHVILYVFVLSNGLQGLFLFLVYCLLNKEVRRIVRDRWERRLVASGIRVPSPPPTQEIKRTTSSV